jgi:type 1 glutamine amidotransferase
MMNRTISKPEQLRRLRWNIAPIRESPRSRRAALALLTLLTAGLGLAAEPVRVQITTGGHPYDISFYGVFEGRSDLTITLNPHPSAYRRDLRRFVDVLVLFDLADVDDEKQRANLQAFLESGKGLVVLHHALADNWQWKWWYEDVVGGRFLMGQDGAMPRSIAKNGEVLNARPVAKHVILDGVGELEVHDEAYKGMWLSPKSQVLMETDNPNNDRAVVWIGPWRKSRVAVIQLGHGPPTFGDTGYRKLVHNAIMWAAGRTN